MNPFALTRTLPDGRKALGPVVYISLTILILAFFAYYNFRASGRVNVAPAQTGTKQSEVEKIRSAANVTTTGVPESTPPPNYGLPPRESTSPFDQVVQANEYDQEEEKETKPADPGEELVLTTPTPVPMPVVAGTPPPIEVNADALYIRGKPPTPTPSPTTNNPTAPAAVAVPSGFETKQFLPRGAIIPVYVLSMIKTGNLEDIVELGVAKNVVAFGKIQLPFGTRILGSSSQEGDGDRIAVNIDTILFPNGDELPISGIVKGTDKGPGIKAYYIPQPLWMQLLPYVNNFIAAYLNSLQNTIVQPITVTDSSGQTATYENQVSDSFDPQTQLVTSAAQALQQATVETMRSLNNLYKPYLVVPPGTPAFVQLRQATDLTRRRVNGSAFSPMPTLKGFNAPELVQGNNTISTRGLDFSQVFTNNAIIPTEQMLKAIQESDTLSGNQIQEGYKPPTVIPNQSGNSGGPVIPDLQNPTNRQQVIPNLPQLTPPLQIE